MRIGTYKSTLAFAILCFVALFNFSHGQDAYYYGKGGAIPLWYSQEKIVVKLTEGALDGGGFLDSDPAINQNRPPQAAPFGFWYIFILPGTDISELMNRLDSNYQVVLASPVYRDSTFLEYVANERVLVQFKPGISSTTIDSMNQANIVTIAESLEAPCATEAWIILKVTKETGLNPLEVANIYEQSSLTQFAVPDFWIPAQLDYQPADSFFVGQWNYNNTGQVPPGGYVDADIDAVEGWEWGLGDSTVIIAVVDDGVEGHEDLPATRLVPGYDWAGDSISGNLPPDNDPSPGDGCLQAHGMACAGLIAASHNGIGVAGLSPNSKIMPIKILDNFGVFTTPANVGTALNWAKQH